MEALETTGKKRQRRRPAFAGRFAGSPGGAAAVWGCFDRQGGAGSGFYASANVSFGVGDDRETVLTNRRLTGQSLSLDTIGSVHQVHGDGVFHLVSRPSAGEEARNYDALVTTLPGVGLMIQQADCQAVLLHDPVKGAVAGVHCGWRGSVCGIIARTVEKMTELFGTDPACLNAVISPSLGPCCSEFVNHVNELPDVFRKFMVAENHFDFWAISRWQLTEAGLCSEKIQTVGVCTCCNHDYFSYRRSRRQMLPATGRNCSIIAVQKQQSDQEATIHHACPGD